MFSYQTDSLQSALTSDTADADLPTPPSMRFHRRTSCRSIYKNLLSLLIGLSIGIYGTGIYFKNTTQCNGNISLLAQNHTSNTTTNTQKPSAAEQETDENIVEYLHNNTRVLCWILTNPNNHLSKAIHIRHTWGRRCNKLLFISSQEDEVLQPVALPVAEGRENLWNKTNLALKYIYDHHFDDAEWFLKADDDTYVIMENLRFFLYKYPPDAPLYFGCKFDRFLRQGYMSGGAGYVLSKEALRKFANEGYNNKLHCPRTHVAEDLQLGSCLENIGVIAGDSRDAKGRERFIPLPPEYVIPNILAEWYTNYVYHSPNESVTCCSPEAISFHYIQPDIFYVLDYLLYALRPFGVFAHSTVKLPAKISISEVYSQGLSYLSQPLSTPPINNEKTEDSTTGYNSRETNITGERKIQGS